MHFADKITELSALTPGPLTRVHEPRALQATVEVPRAPKRWLLARLEALDALAETPTALKDTHTWDFIGVSCRNPVHPQDARKCVDCGVVAAGLATQLALAETRGIVPFVAQQLHAGMDARERAVHLRTLEAAGYIAEGTSAAAQEAAATLIRGAREQARELEPASLHGLFGRSETMMTSYFTWCLHERGLALHVIAAVIGALRTPRADVDLTVTVDRLRALTSKIAERIAYVQKALARAAQKSNTDISG